MRSKSFIKTKRRISRIEKYDNSKKKTHAVRENAMIEYMTINK